MLLIPCPWCGPRDDTEFRYGAESGAAMPQDTPRLSDRAWAEWVFVRANPKGPLRERWNHSHGCRRWFAITRDTATDQFLSEPAPLGWPKPPPGSGTDPAPAVDRVNRPDSGQP